jgi:photosystem II stability/assembly factor-like uncharacterized protein
MMRSLYYCAFTFALLLLAVPAALYAQQWSSVTPDGLTSDLYGVDFLDANNGWIVGWSSAGSVLGKTTDGGANWQGWNLPSTLLFDIHFNNAGRGAIAGYRADCNCGLLLQTTDGGANWSEQLFDSTLPVYSFGFYRVVFTTPATGYLSGYNSALLKTTDGGSSWKRGAVESANEVFRLLEFATPATGYAVSGDDGDFSTLYKIYRTTDAGESWQLIKNFEKKVFIGGLAFRDAQTGFLAGNGEGGGMISKTTDGGQTWRRVYSGPAQEMFQTIRFANASVGYAVGAGADGTSGVVVRTTDGGETWTKEVPGGENPQMPLLTNISLLADGSAYAVGFGGVVVKRLKSAASVAAHQPVSGSITVAPNPFHSSARLSLDDLALDGDWALTLHDILGREVRSIQGSGEEAIVIERDALTAGTYIYTIRSNGKVKATGTMTVY